MTPANKSPIDSFRLTPTLYKEDSSEGSRTHAAFAVSMRIPFTATKGDPLIILRLNMASIISDQLAVIEEANAWPGEKDGKKHLAALGIPETYASSFKELKDFLLDKDCCTLYNLQALGAMVVFGGSGFIDCPSSLTMRFGPIPFGKRLQGNYREVEASYTAENKHASTSVSANPLIQCIAHTERADVLVRVDQSALLVRMLGVELTKGYLEIEFTLIDRRTRMLKVEGSYGDS